MPKLYNTYPAKHTSQGGPNKGQVVTITSYNPEKYSAGTGPNYIGEIGGYIYVPYMNDGRGGYQPDEKAYENEINPPEDPPGVFEQVAPIAAASGAFALGQTVFDADKRRPLIKDIGSIFDFEKEGVDKAEGMLNELSGANAPAQAAEAVPGAQGLMEGYNTATGSFSTPTAVGSGPGGQTMMAGPGGETTMVAGENAGLLTGAEGAFATYGIPAIAAASAIGMGQTAYDTLVKGEEPGTKADVLWGANPVTAWAYWPMKWAGVLGHKSTSDYHKERVSKLGPAGQDYFAKGAEFEAQNPDHGTWTEGKYAGESWTFEKAQDLASEDPTHFIGNMGNFDTFGDQWVTTPLDKQKIIVSRLIGEGLYVSDKGDVMIDHEDQARAKEIYNEEMGIAPAPPPPTDETEERAYNEVLG